jgi:hypothetical protein
MATHLRRRDFIVTLGSAAAVLPRAARAQAPDIPVVGFLHAGNERPRAVASFQKGLAEGGYVADRNVAFTSCGRWRMQRACSTGVCRCSKRAAKASSTKPSSASRSSGSGRWFAKGCTQHRARAHQAIAQKKAETSTGQNF